VIHKPCGFLSEANGFANMLELKRNGRGRETLTLED